MSVELFVDKFKTVAREHLKEFGRLFFGFFFPLAAFCSPLVVSAQSRIVFLFPEKNPVSRIAAEKLQSSLSKNFRILDAAMAEAVAFSQPDRNIFNLSAEDARNLGAAIGCNFFIVAKAQTLRRASLSKPDYYEAHLVIYLVSSRTGRLVFWKFSKFEDEVSENADKKLFASIENSADEIAENIKSADEKELGETEAANIREMPAADSPDAKDFRSPLPYRRLKPEYTSLANLYGVAATIDASVDLDENGRVARVEIVRWAGYGLDESVAETIRRMQWRAASIDGRALPIRILLRYNFKKLNPEERNNEQ